MSKKADQHDESGELQTQITELTVDLQRTRADFENYRKRAEIDKDYARQSGKSSAILKLLPVIDNIERAIGHLPEDLKDNAWAQGVSGLVKSLEKSLDGLDLHRIDATPGTDFNPDLHEAIQFDEDAEGEKEVIIEELQPGYRLGNAVLRHSMVKVGKG